MAKFQILDEEFKQNVSDSCEKIKDKLSDALLTEEGNLDTEKIGSAARDTIKKVEEGVKDGYQKFSDNFIGEDGHLDTEKVGEAVNSTYRKAGRFLATGMTRLAEKLADKFGVQEENGEIIDSELVTEEPAEEAGPEKQECHEVTAEPEAFVSEEPVQEA